MTHLRDSPAFPAVIPHPGEVHDQFFGVSRHDYFAAHAPAMPANFERKSWQTQQVQEHAGGFKKEVSVRVYESIPAWHARWAKAYADEMVAERAA